MCAALPRHQQKGHSTLVQHATLRQPVESCSLRGPPTDGLIFSEILAAGESSASRPQVHSCALWARNRRAAKLPSSLNASVQARNPSFSSTSEKEGFLGMLGMTPKGVFSTSYLAGGDSCCRVREAADLPTWLAPGSVTSMTLPSGLNEISAGEAAPPLGSDCVEPAIGTRVFDACASGTIRKPAMLGVAPPAFSTCSRSWCTVRLVGCVPPDEIVCRGVSESPDTAKAVMESLPALTAKSMRLSPLSASEYCEPKA